MARLLRHLVRAIVLLALALLPALVGQAEQVPLESHEVFVVRTAEEMVARGDYLVPHFNDRPRINKPPLSYWLVVGVDRLTGGDGRVTPLEGRAVSIAAGAVCVMCVYAIGAMLGGALAGWLAALMLSGSVGFMLYTHSARPDMLYAACLAIATTGCTRLFVHRRQGGVSRAPAWVLAAVVGGLFLATMTKGPWAPLGLLLGVAAGSWTQLGRAEVRHVARPVLSVAAIAVPFVGWYGLMLWAAAHQAGGSWGEEIGRRLDSGAWWNWFEPYYPIRIVQLVAPWWPLYALALILPVFPFWRRRRSAMFVWWLFVASLVIWQVLPGRRLHYALPALVLLCPLMGLIGMTMLRLARQHLGALRRTDLLLRLLAATLLGGAVVGMTVCAGTEGSMVFGVLGCAALGVAVLLETRQLARAGALISLGVLSALLSGAVAFTGIGWSLERTEARGFARAVASHVQEEATLVAWRGDWEVAQYYLGRTIPRIREVDDIAAMAAATGPVYVLTDRPLKADAALRVHETCAEGGFRTEIAQHRLYVMTAAPGEPVCVERLCTSPGCALTTGAHPRPGP